MPFVTEEIWQRFGVPEPASLALASWPVAIETHADPGAEVALASVQEVVTAIRQFRSKHGISPKDRFSATAGVRADLTDVVRSQADAALRLAGVTLEVADAGSKQVPGTTRVALTEGWVELSADLFDTSAERERLTKQRGELEAHARACGEEARERGLPGEGGAGGRGP